MTGSNKPYAESSEQNRLPILEVIRPLFVSSERVLEIGSGTGQHAVCFAKELPHLLWQASDRVESLNGISLWLNEAGLGNTPPPLELDVASPKWPEIDADAVFSANAVHIMDWSQVEAFFAGVGSILSMGGIMALYGPFNRNQEFTSKSNASFDVWLKARDPVSGIRDMGDLDGLANRAGMERFAEFSMPENNFILCWKKQ